MPGEQVTFRGATGARLAARLDRPQGPARAYALFAHCFSCTKDNLAAKRVAEGLTEAGIATLRFDFTGLGHSEGELLPVSTGHRHLPEGPGTDLVLRLCPRRSPGSRWSRWGRRQPGDGVS